MIPGIMILDELDSGVGGRLGAPVGRMLRRMVLPQAGGRAATSQILCVSHLPQVSRRAGWDLAGCPYMSGPVASQTLHRRALRCLAVAK